MLYNFHDTPADLFERMRLNVTLNEELGVRIWSFPMRYQPTDRPDRGHISEKWTRYQLRSMQTILQATHGIVSGEPDFFKRAFGDEVNEFERILLLPNDYIFNRDWYERFDGRPELSEYTRVASKLDAADRAELLVLLSSTDPRNFKDLVGQASNDRLKRVLPFYIPKPKSELFEIWARQKQMALTQLSNIGLAEDERVEDAGLDAEEAIIEATRPRPRRKVSGAAA
jgi:hypothetical protein